MPEVTDGEPGRRPYHIYLRDGYISPSPVEMTSQGQDLATSSYSKQAPATITANPVSVAAHRTETMTSTQELSNALEIRTGVPIAPDCLDNLGNSVLSSQKKCRLYAACVCFAVEAGNSWGSTYLTLRQTGQSYQKKVGGQWSLCSCQKPKPIQIQPAGLYPTIFRSKCAVLFEDCKYQDSKELYTRPTS